MASANFVRGASLDQEVDATFRTLVGSLDLPPDVAARIRDIISRTAVARDGLAAQLAALQPAPTTDSGTVIPGLWSRTMLLLAERNAAITALLTDPEQRRTFEAHAAAELQQLAAARPNPAT